MNHDKDKDQDIRAADARNAQQDFGGNIANGHRANNVITPQRDGMPSTEQGKHTVDRGAGDFSSQHADQAGRAAVPRQPALPAVPTKGERGTRGSGMPVDSGAGQLADDRPGRDTPKGG